MNKNDSREGVMKASELYGRKVYVGQTLASAPPHSGDAQYGFMLDGTPYDLNDRVPCGAVGTVMQHDTKHPGIVAVGFVNKALRDEDDPHWTEQTVAFVAIEDLAPTDAEESWPVNTDHMTVV